ncbi:hypothetical protein PV11_06090 [Exophiala sideris]|uniref:Glucose-methanol-choline oxidoreductase N-terminal domain-containing protein n=1 Tax=Exophiala sideris TaxID=1016849 RepID=A0A0D1ZBJ5_9EURO|nr:hypothetical protein PV11_06090 [Exophiala sideris]
MAKKYDFIVVGSGAAGAIVAWRLAHSKKHPSVLLVEAGGKNDSKEIRADAERWLHKMSPDQNWGYKSTAVTGFDGRVIDYDRGKGLGGSTSINFSVWTIGSKDDHDEIARIVGDEEWKWSNAQQRYKRIESYHGAPSDAYNNLKKYLDPKPENHGSKGPIHTGFPRIVEQSAIDVMGIWAKHGTKLNPDHNSGDPTGLAMSVSTAYNGVRSTAADALRDPPENLHIMTNTEISRLIFHGTKAVGVTTFTGEEIYADKEIILSCGSLDTPRVLMHSGIGPQDQLDSFKIPIVRANKNVGQHMKDHHHIALEHEQSDHCSERQKFYRDKQLHAAAKVQWEKDGTGPLAEFACAMGIGFLKLESLSKSPEFQALPEGQKRHLEKPTVPHYELLLNMAHIPHFIDPENATAGSTILVFVLNTQSVGSATLQSSNPKVPLKFDPNFFSHPYDRRVAVEATHEVLKIIGSPEFSKDVIAVQGAPASESEADILEYWKKNSGSTWHMMGTTRMGRNEDDAVVDKDFKVFGVQNLRVADAGVIPVVVNNHTQTTAYLVGLMAGDKLVAEYGLDE